MSHIARRLTLLASVLLLAPAAGGQSPAPTDALTVGQPFPTLTLPALEDGRPRSMTEFRGRKVILHVFASW